MILFILLVCLSTATATNSTKDATSEIKPASNSTKELLKASETSDPSKVEIVKQIRRLNDDGSYTIGYEADDGTFKIESRDVLGNVKGTFGYIDQDGEIKRVTYTSSSDATPTPVQVSTTTTPMPPPMVVRMNKTVSSTTRRPLATVVYPTRSSSSSYTTRGPAVQTTPRRRTTLPPTTNIVDTTTEQQKVKEQSNILNLYKSKTDENVTKTRIQVLKAMSDAIKEDMETKQTTAKTPRTIKPVYEQTNEKEPEVTPNKANTIRRELTGTSPNPHMLNLQQSAGDDSTDVYGSHLSLGTVRPLFTTTTPRPRLVPIHSLVAARQKIHQQYREVPPQDQETTIEASNGRVFDLENVVTSNPVPVVHIPQRDDRIYQHQVYRRPNSGIHFRTNEYLRDNPGAPIPIGNQRPFLHYQLQNKVLEPQYVKEQISAQTKDAAPETATAPSYDVRPVTRIIPIPVDERGVPIQGYQARYINEYRPTQPPPLPQPQILFQQRHEPQDDEVSAISTPVSTRDLKRLLQILIYRQNRLQSLMDQIVSPGPPYQSQPAYTPRHEQQQYDRYHGRQYQDEDQYDYRYDQQQRYRQQELYSNQVSNYESPQYESQRYVPRRRLYSRAYDATGSSSNRVEDNPEFLPPDVREALLLKMLMLAINPDYMPTPLAPPTELTTAAPPRKQVRNVQILGEEGSMDMKRSMQRH